MAIKIRKSDLTKKCNVVTIIIPFSLRQTLWTKLVDENEKMCGKT